MNIIRVTTSLLAVLRSGVIPVESPTVPNADTISKRICIMLKIWLQNTERKGSGADYRQRKKGNQVRLGNGFAGDASVKGSEMPFIQRASHRLEKREKGTCLDTASCRTGRSADKHQDAQNKEACVCESAQRICGKSGGPGGYAVEKGSKPGNILCCFQKKRSCKNQKGAGA